MLSLDTEVLSCSISSTELSDMTVSVHSEHDLVRWLVFNGISAQPRYIVAHEYEMYYVWPGDKTNASLKNETKH